MNERNSGHDIYSQVVLIAIARVQVPGSCTHDAGWPGSKSNHPQRTILLGRGRTHEQFSFSVS